MLKELQTSWKSSFPIICDLPFCDHQEGLELQQHLKTPWGRQKGRIKTHS